ncbi:oxidoreductase [Rhizobium sp. LjRoot254]|uniref:oxidoreductase n=1 Tax=Rhizobium sp. LjRoot254 TaxID=3342297 RepID=UPI003ED079BE
MSENSLRTAVVTGASSGIGRASAEALAQAGFKVFGTSRRPSSGGPDGVSMLICDVTDEASVNFLVETVLSKTGRIDILVNNAGLGLIGGAEESSARQAQIMFDVNVFGVIRMTNAVLPHMRKQRNGRIINISSVLGFIPAPFSALYASTKHALEGYTESLDHELREHALRAILIEPAYTRTAFDQNAVSPDRPMAAYETARQNAATIIQEAMRTADEPRAVADIVVKAATAVVPKKRYTVGKLASQLSLLRRFVPAFAFDKSLRKQLGLDRV